LHLDLSNTNIDDESIPDLAKIVRCSPELISLGLDFGKVRGLTESGVNALTNSILGNDCRFASLALGFGDLKILGPSLVKNLSLRIKEHSATLKFLRLNFSNTNITSSDLEQIHDLLLELNLEHLELFLGGNKSVDDACFKRVASYLGASSLRGFVLDVGYSDCSKKCLKAYLKTPKLGLRELGLHLNG
jgi:hypothetical protein